jgi:membrane-associated phospholipid phosphatase
MGWRDTVEPALGTYTFSFAPSRIYRNLLISVVVFLLALALALVPEAFDRPAARLINGFANRSWLFDYSVAAASKYFTFSGAALMALIWYCWFENNDLEHRTRILVGTLASLGAGMISRLLQHALPTHPRPYYDPVLDFHRPLSLEPPSNTWDSFPSDHVAVFAGLAIVLYIARPRFVMWAILGTIIVESFRAYMGAHYPSDLLAGAALAGSVVWASQTSGPIALGKKVMRCERLSPGLFYLIAFFLSYQIATLFADVRNTLGPVRDHILGSSARVSAPPNGVPVLEPDERRPTRS